MAVGLAALRPRAREERGAVAVEAALVTPLLLLLVFGIIEMSLLMRDHVAVSSAVRVGGRIASASADAAHIPCTDPSVPCSPEHAPGFAQAAADAIQRAGSAMPKDSIDFILVYEANADGFPGAATDLTDPEASCSTNCVKYVWSESANKFQYASGAWDSAMVNACANDADAASVGVYLQADHDFVTGIFAETTTVSDHAVMKFEPLTWETCQPGTRT